MGGPVTSGLQMGANRSIQLGFGQLSGQTGDDIAVLVPSDRVLRLVTVVQRRFLVRDALAGNGNLAELVASHASLGPVAAQLLEPGVSVSKRTTHGGAGPTAVAAQLLEAHKRLQADLATAETIRARVTQ